MDPVRYLRYYVNYTRKANRAVRKKLRSVITDAAFTCEGSEADGTIKFNERTFPLFINVYPHFDEQQAVEDVHTQSVGGKPALRFYVAPKAAAEELRRLLTQDYDRPEDAVYIWPVDQSESEDEDLSISETGSWLTRGFLAS